MGLRVGEVVQVPPLLKTREARNVCLKKKPCWWWVITGSRAGLPMPYFFSFYEGASKDLSKESEVYLCHLSRSCFRGLVTGFSARMPGLIPSHSMWHMWWQNGTEVYTRVGTLIVATIYLQLIQNKYMFRSFTVLQCSHQHCVQPVASDVEFVGYL